MPVYSYRCGTCGLQFDRKQKFSDQPLVRCPECGKKSLHKVYLPIGIVFKGPGFYATDHHSPSGQSNKQSSEEKEEKKEKGESKEPKPDTCKSTPFVPRTPAARTVRDGRYIKSTEKAE